MNTLSYDTVTASGAQPARWLYMLHGIFGSGRNWASVARRLVRDRPGWGVRLLDLRQHGGSTGFQPPHTLESAARDVYQLAESLGESPVAILGHSFGGKVALMYASEHGDALEQVWIIDSTPESRPPGGSAWQMLDIIRALPGEFRSRNELIEQLRENGVAVPTAQWMATNLEEQGGVYRWRFDLDAIEDLLLDFFATDLWRALENPPGHAHIHVVKAEESDVLSPGAVRRIEELSKDGRVSLHVVAGGHWVNAENPDALHALLVQYFQ